MLLAALLIAITFKSIVIVHESGIHSKNTIMLYSGSSLRGASSLDQDTRFELGTSFPLVAVRFPPRIVYSPQEQGNRQVESVM